MGDGECVRCRVCSGMKESDALESWDCEDSIDIADARGERGNANLMELKRLPPFDLSSVDFFENAEDGADDVGLLDDDDPRNNENAGGSGRGWGAETGGDGVSGRNWVSGETIISSASNSSSSSNIELALSVDIDVCVEDSSSPSSVE